MTKLGKLNSDVPIPTSFSWEENLNFYQKADVKPLLVEAA